MILGLTGGIATGKSVVATQLRALGIKIIDADVVAKEIVYPGSEALNQIRKHFGEDILLASGELDRKKLAAIIFADTESRMVLEKILHPTIYKEMHKQTERYFTEGTKLVVWEVPLLIEKDLTEVFDEVILVYTPRNLQLQRLMARDNLTAAEANARIDAQLDIEEKRKLADIIIDNSEDIATTQREVRSLFESNYRF